MENSQVNSRLVLNKLYKLAIWLKSYGQGAWQRIQLFSRLHEEKMWLASALEKEIKIDKIYFSITHQKL